MSDKAMYVIVARNKQEHLIFETDVHSSSLSDTVKRKQMFSSSRWDKVEIMRVVPVNADEIDKELDVEIQQLEHRLIELKEARSNKQ